MSVSNRGFIILSLFLLFTAKTAEALADTVETKLPRVVFDSMYLADYTDLLTARLFILFQNVTLEISPAGTQAPKIVYRPNTNIRVGIAGFWRWFGLGLSIDNPFYKTDREAYGKTTTLDLRVNAFGRFLAGELFVQRYRGFFISSPEKPDSKHYIVSDMQTFSLGLSGYWIANARRFSIRAAFIQNERQKKSAGSFVVRPSLLYYRISSGHGIIPQGIIDTYHIPSENLISGGEFYSIGLSPGYAYTLVFLKNCYITGAFFPGVAAKVSSYTSTTKDYDGVHFAFQFSGRLALGYNSGNWFLGGSIQTGFNEAPDQINQAIFSYNLAQIRVWGGMRFDVFRKKK